MSFRRAHFASFCQMDEIDFTNFRESWSHYLRTAAKHSTLGAWHEVWHSECIATPVREMLKQKSGPASADGRS
jgi:hypothetical protein